MSSYVLIDNDRTQKCPTSECYCCTTKKWCRAYNIVGVIFFVVFFVLQICSAAFSWFSYYLSRTVATGIFSGTRTTVSLNIRLVEVLIIGTYFVPRGPYVESRISCPYDKGDYSHVGIIQSILYDPTSSQCPPTSNLAYAIEPILAFSVISILSIVAHIGWMIFRSTDKGFLCLKDHKCSSFSISLVLSVITIIFSTLSYAWRKQVEDALIYDFGVQFWTSYGCLATGLNNTAPYLQCSSNFQFDCPSSFNCYSYSEINTGYILAVTDMILLVLCCFYSFLGSWCCTCCGCVEPGDQV